MTRVRCDLTSLPTLVASLAPYLKFGQSIGLKGALGAGKTTLIKQFMQQLGYELDVSSPSYVLEHLYELSDGSVVSHWDLYRCRDVPDELWEPPASTCMRLVEWPESLEKYGLLDGVISISFDERAAEVREFEFEGALFDKYQGIATGA